ncbi:carbohydrate binding domain-containing protein [Crossiella sp. CA198]|uniref:carbohydrate binding domain-containing protein n=1 Tax=Crossiella sp. CA198 TaxID=3455607 RepID=UPI003F8D161D
MPSVPVVEVAFSTDPLSVTPVWTDITRHVLLDQGIAIRRGRSDELATIQAGTCRMSLGNRDGRFTPGNSSSPYYPYVRRGRRMRVRQVHVETNYITNPSMETDAADWSAAGTVLPTVAQSATRAHHGTKSLLVTWGTGGTGPAAQITLLGLEVGTAYTATAWVWVAASSVAVRLGVSGIATGTASTTTGAWEQISYTWTATAVQHILQLTPATAATSGHQVWLDEVMVGAGSSPVTFSATAALVSSRYNGFVNGWPVHWPGGALMSAVDLGAADLFRRLNQRKLRSLLEEEVLVDAPLAYYPMSEPRDSLYCGDISGNAGGASLGLVQAGSGGTLEFGGSTGPAADGLAAPKFTPVDANNGMYFFADLSSEIEAATATGYISLECWLSTDTQGRTLMMVRSSDHAFKATLSLESGTGKLKIVFRQQLASATVVWNTGNLADGSVHHVVYEESGSGGRVWVDGVDKGLDAAVLLLANLRRLEIGGTDGVTLWSGGGISHVAIYATGGGLGGTRIGTHNTAGANGFAGEGGNARAPRLAAYAGAISVATQGSTWTQLASQGAGGKTVLAMMQEAAATESAQVFAARSNGITYQSRDVRYNRAASVTLAAVDLEADIAWADDDQFLFNVVNGSRPNGPAIRVRDTASITANGTYESDLNLLHYNDSNLLDAVNWRLNRHADPAPRLNRLPIEGARLPTATYRALLEVTISDVIAVTGLQSQAPASSATVTVEGYTELIKPGQHFWSFDTSPSVVDQVWVLDSSTYSVLGTSTRLAL